MIASIGNRALENDNARVLQGHDLVLLGIIHVQLNKSTTKTGSSCIYFPLEAESQMISSSPK